MKDANDESGIDIEKTSLQSVLIRGDMLGEVAQIQDGAWLEHYDVVAHARVEGHSADFAGRTSRRPRSAASRHAKWLVSVGGGSQNPRYQCQYKPDADVRQDGPYFKDSGGQET